MSTKLEIKLAAGLKEPEGARLEFIINKIRNDHEVLDIASRLAADAFIATAVKSMTSDQLARLLKRSQPEPQPQVRWGFMIGQQTQKPLISAEYGKESVFFDCPPEQMAQVLFHNQHVPAGLLERYRAVYNPPTTVQDAAYWIAATHKPKEDAPRFVPGFGLEK